MVFRSMRLSFRPIVYAMLPFVCLNQLKLEGLRCSGVNISMGTTRDQSLSVSKTGTTRSADITLIR